MTSICEEPEQQHPPQMGQRNTAIRSSKDGIKAQAHKALAGFKKSKDKDKEKDKDKDKESKSTPNKKDEGPPKPPSRKISTTSLVGGGSGSGSGSAINIRPTILHENANGGEIVIPLQPIIIPNGKSTQHIDTNSSDFESSSFDATDSPNFSIEIQGSSNIEPSVAAHHIQNQV